MDQPITHPPKTNIKISGWIIFLGLILIFIPIIAYSFFFASNAISSKPVDWSGFGTYIDGTVGTIVNLFNLLFLIIITIRLANLDKDRHAESIANQDQIAIQNNNVQTKINENAIRNNAYFDIIGKLGMFAPLLLDEKRNNFRIDLVLSEVESFSTNMKHLFPINQEGEIIRPLVLSMKALIELSENGLVTVSREVKDKFSEELSRYVELKAKFIYSLQETIIK